MADLKNYILKAKIMMIIEIGLLAFTFIIFSVLENLVVGIYFTLHFVNIFLWVILFILTVNLYYRAKKIEKN